MLKIHPIFGIQPVLKEIEAFDVVDLRASSTLQALRALVEQVAIESEPIEAQDLFRALEKALKKFPQFEIEAPAEYVRAREMVVHLKFLSLSSLEDEEADELLKFHFLFAIVHDINLRDFLYARFSMFEDGINQGAMRKRFVRILQDNKERLGEQPLIVGKGPLTQSPTIGNWLKNYDGFFPIFTTRGSFERLRYLNEGADIKQLNRIDKSNLLKVLEIYDFIKFPSVSLKERGVVIPATENPTPAKPIITVKPLSGQAVLKAIGEDNADQQVLDRQAEAIWSSMGGDKNKLLDSAYNFVFPPPSAKQDADKVKAILMVLAKHGALDSLLTEARFKKAFTDYLRAKDNQAALQGFALQPTAPQYMSLFLRFVLEGQLKMSENDAARFGIRLGNLMKQAGQARYQHMAYFDQESGEFKWKI